MSDVWQTIEQAAVTLGLSVRTVNRHITAGKLQSRLFEGRREVLVESGAELTQAMFSQKESGLTDDVAEQSGPQLTTDAFPPQKFTDANNSVDRPTTPVSAALPYTSARQAVHTQVTSEKSIDSQMVLALADSIDDKATLAISAYQTLARSSEYQVQSLRRVAFGAWATVAVIAIGFIVALGWGLRRMTLDESHAAYLLDNKQTLLEDKRDLNNRLSALADERELLRKEIDRLRSEAVDRQRRADEKSAASTVASTQANAMVDLTTQIKRLIESRVVQSSSQPSMRPTTGAIAETGNLTPAPIADVSPSGPFQFSAPTSRRSSAPLTRPNAPSGARSTTPNPQDIFGVP